MRHQNRKFQSSLIGLLAAVVSACMSPLPKGEATALDVASARSNAAAAPAEIRWGGTITEVRNTTDSATEIEVVSRPLGRNGRPLRNDRSDGRFVARIDAFLDPEIVKKGRDITVTGTFTGLRSGQIGETDYRFPQVEVVDYHYWRPRPAVNPAHFPHPALYPHHGWHDDFWHDWPHDHRHYRDRRRVTGIRGRLIVD